MLRRCYHPSGFIGFSPKKAREFVFCLHVNSSLRA